MLSRRAFGGAGGLVYVGGQTGGATSAGTSWPVTFSLTGGVASTPALGDLILVIQVSTRASTLSVSPSSGGAYSDVMSEDYDEISVNVWHKFSDGDTGVTFNATIPVTGSAQVYVVHVWRGVSVSSPMDVSPVTATGIRAADGPADYVDPPAITPVTPGAVLILVGAVNYSIGNAMTAPSFTRFFTHTQNATENAQIGVGAYEHWGGGAYDPPAFTIASNSYDTPWFAATLALRPE